MIYIVCILVLAVLIMNFAFNRLVRRDLKKVDDRLALQIKTSQRVRRSAGIIPKR